MRVFKRFFRKDGRIDDRASNCHETVQWSLLKYMWSFENRVNPILHQLKINYPKVSFIEIRSNNELMKVKKLFNL